MIEFRILGAFIWEMLSMIIRVNWVRVVVVAFGVAGFATSVLAATPPRTSGLGARPDGSPGSGGLGLGVMIGQPTGLTAKHWMNRQAALQFGAAYSFDHYLDLLADFAWHFPNAFANDRRFVPYVGGGAVLMFGTWSNERWVTNRYDDRVYDVALALRVPLGIEFLPTSAPIGVFAEIAPGVGLMPRTWGFVQGVVGIRFYL